MSQNKQSITADTEEIAKQGPLGWFSYSNDGGYDTWGSLEEAINAGNESLSGAREEANHDGEWSDEAESIQYGVILGRAIELVMENGCVDYEISSPVSADTRMTTAAADVLAERCRQVAAEGWTPEHDDEHATGEMSRAAACYAQYGDWAAYRNTAPNDWPWHESWWKPSDSRRNLVKAAALILAEIERIDRIEFQKGRDQQAEAWDSIKGEQR